MATVAFGTGGAQLIGIAFAPLLTRLYGPEAFGLLGTFMAVMAVAAPIAALTYPLAIVLPRKDEEATLLAKLALIISAVISGLAAITLLIGFNVFPSIASPQTITTLMLTIPLAMLFSAWLQIARQWTIRNERFGHLATIAIANSMAANGAKAGAGLLHPSGLVLIAITAAAQALHALLLFMACRRHAETKRTTASPTPTLKTLARKYRDFPLYRAPQNFINAFSQSMPIFALALLFGPAAAGFYTIGKMVLGTPSTLLGNAVSDVFYPHITRKHHEGSALSHQIVKATSALAIVGVIPFGLIILLGPSAFAWIFGAEWEKAGNYAQWLTIFFFFNFINKPSVAAVPVLGIQRGLLLYEVFSTGSKLAALFVGFYWMQSDIAAVAMFSIIGAIAYAAMIVWIINTARNRDQHGQAS